MNHFHSRQYQSIFSKVIFINWEVVVTRILLLLCTCVVYKHTRVFHRNFFDDEKKMSFDVAKIIINNNSALGRKVGSLRKQVGSHTVNFEFTRRQ